MRWELYLPQTLNLVEHTSIVVGQANLGWQTELLPIKDCKLYKEKVNGITQYILVDVLINKNK